jgi:dihydroxyacetone kinase
MKHFINRRENVVTEALDGLLETTPLGRLARLDTYPDIKVILRAGWDKAKVAVISGGGAGHEPSHAGFVGEGMLTAAVSGEIFASPSVDAVLTGIRAVTGTPGCLLVVKNYTGDRLNFGLAAEKARAEGFRVEMVIVGDDIALPDIAQPRGVAGTLFVHKIAGYLAGRGESLEKVAVAAAAAARDIASLGVSLTSCSIPGRTHEERLGAGEGELGLGIHGEPGAERIPLQDVEHIIALMSERLMPILSPDADHALLINNLGAVPPLEMNLIAHAVLKSPIADRVTLVLGPAPLMTALNMNGFSLSLLKLDAAREKALIAPVEPNAWVAPVRRNSIEIVKVSASATARAEAPASRNAQRETMLTAICNHLISLEAELNRLDARAGDGDTGSTVAAGARSLLSALHDMALDDMVALLAAIGSRLATSMGGSSGVLLSIFFTAASKKMADGAGLPEALLAGLDRMSFYGGARVGDRTMIDALEPALNALAAGDLIKAARAAREGAEHTKSMTKAKAGRAAYVSERDLGGSADPGSVAIAEVFELVARMV